MPRFFIWRATRQLNAGESMTMARSGFRRSASRIRRLVQPENFRQVAENLSDADDGKVFGIDDGVAARRAHAVAAHAKKLNG